MTDRDEAIVEREAIQKAIKAFYIADVEYLRAQHTGEQPRLNKAGTRYACAKFRLFKVAGVRR